MTDPALPLQDHGGNIRQIQRRLGLEQVLDFSASINPLGQPAGLREHLFSHWQDVAHYPDRECSRLVAAIAARHRVPVTQLVVGNGSAELIELLLRAFRPNRLVLSPPDFGLYREVAPEAVATLAVPRRKDRGFAPDIAALTATLRDGDLVLLSNPGNPSGYYAPPEELTPLAATCADRGAHLVVDEAFAEFQPGATSLPLVGAKADRSVLRSLTKFYGIPGLRLGFLASPPERAQAVRRLQVPWSVNALAQLAGCYCLDDPGWTTTSIATVTGLRSELAMALAALPGVQPLDSAANYLLLRLDSPAPPAQRVYSDLARRGILVRHCGSFGLGESYLRVAVRGPEENQRLVENLSDLASSW